MPYALTIVTEPTAEPVTVDELKTHLRITQSAHDVMLAGLITGARIKYERANGRQLITATWKLELDGFPEDGVIYMPRPPLQWTGNTHVKYWDTSGVQQTLVKDTDYVGDITSEPGRIRPAYSTVWPTTRDIMNAVEIQFDAGYGAAADVPELIKLGIKGQAARWFMEPESIEIPGQYKMASFG